MSFLRYNLKFGENDQLFESPFKFQFHRDEKHIRFRITSKFS